MNGHMEGFRQNIYGHELGYLQTRTEVSAHKTAKFIVRSSVYGF